MTEEQLRELIDMSEISEKEYIERVGRRLNTILEAVRETKNVAKPVQIALADAIAVFKQVTGIRKQRLNAAERLKNLENHAAAASVKNVDIDPVNNLSCIATSDATTQSSCWWDSMPQDNIGGDRMDGGSKLLTEVVRKKPAKKVNPIGKKAETDGTTEVPFELTREGISAKQATKQQRIRSRPLAILVNVSTEEFPELAKKIRDGVNAEIIGNSVVKTRQSKSGGLLIEVRGDQTQVEAVRAEVARSAGSEVEVRALQQRALVEIGDLDQWTSTDEIVAAMSTAAVIGQDVIKVVSLRERYGGSQTALVSVPLGASRELINSSRLLVGMVYCRVRMADPKVRCFLCLSYGHMAKDCGGPERTKCCRRCGGTEHKAVGCSAPASAVSEFVKLLTAGTSGDKEARSSTK